MFQHSFSRSFGMKQDRPREVPRKFGEMLLYFRSQSLTETILFLLFLSFKHFEAAGSSNIELETQQIVAFVHIAFHQKKQKEAKT